MVSGPIFFRILGPIRAEQGGEPLELPGSKGKAIAGLLLMRAGRVVTVDGLVDAVWGTEPPPTVRKAIQVYVWKLRRLFEGDEGVRLETRDQGYVLEVDPERLDVTRFERLIERAGGALGQGDAREAIELLESALALWRGEPLEGVDLAFPPEADIATLHELRASARETRLEAELALGRHRDALYEVETLLADNPLGERVHALASLAYYRSGRQADALHVLARLKRSLSAELGLSPGPAIEELERRILQRDPDLDLPSEQQERSRAVREGRKTVAAAVLLLAPGGGDPEIDPETRLAALSTMAETAGSIVESYGGVVTERLGGRISVLFGVPVLHEDDALRAARAAAAIRDAITPALGGRQGFAAGIAVGEVMVRRSGSEEVLLSADPVRIADQLGHAARPGEILLTRAAARLAGGAPLLEEAETLLLDTAGSPMLVYRLGEERVLAEGTTRRLRSPLVGRTEELASLRQTFGRVVREPTCSLATVFGPAGVGKSRLVEEFVGSITTEARALNGRCLSYGSDITYWPIAEMLRQAAGIVPTDRGDEVRPKLAALLGDEAGAPMILEHALSVLGLGSGAPDRDELFWAIRRVFQSLAQRRPLVLVFDDLHWAEPSLLDLIEHVATASLRTPVFVLCTSRPDLLERRTGWGGGGLDAANIALDALSQAQSVEMITNLVRGAPLPGDVLDRIVEVTEGHALYIEEYVATLIDEGMLTWTGERWESALEPEEALPTPTSVHALLAARLDRLSPAARSLLEGASVIGREFSLRELEAAAPEVDTDVALPELLARDVVLEEPHTPTPERRLSFRHILIRDVAYQGMAKAARAEAHLRLAEHVEREAGDRIAEVEEIVGYHLEAAHRYAVERGAPDEDVRALGRRAATHLASSGRRAFLRDDMSAAAGLLSRAMGLLDGQDRLVPEVAWRLGVALFETGRLEEAERVLEDGRRTAESLDANGLAWRMRLELAELDFWRHPEARSTLELEGLSDAAIAECTRLEDWGTVARAYRLKGDALGRRGVQGAALVAYEEGQGYALRVGDEREANERGNLGLVLGPLPVEICIEHSRKQLDSGRRVTPEIHSQLGLAYAMAGRVDEADEAIEVALAQGREFGAEWKLASIVMYQAVALLIQGRAAEAETALVPTVEALERMGEKSMFSSAVALLAEARYRQGNLEGAMEATIASEDATAPDDLASQMAWRGVRAKVLADHGELEPAERLARSAVDHADRTDMLTFVGDAHVDLGLVLSRAGKTDEAVAQLERAIAIFGEKGNVVSAERAREILRRVRSPASTSGR